MDRPVIETSLWLSVCLEQAATERVGLFRRRGVADLPQCDWLVDSLLAMGVPFQGCCRVSLESVWSGATRVRLLARLDGRVRRTASACLDRHLPTDLRDLCASYLQHERSI